MSFEHKVVIGGDKDVTIRELSVREVREMATAASVSGDDPLSHWLIEDVPFIVLAAMTDVTIEQMDEWRPSELKLLADKCREVNPDFFGMDRRIKAAVEMIQSKGSTLK